MLGKIVSYHRRRALLARRLWSRGSISWGTDLSTIAPTILSANANVTLTASTVVTAIHSQSGGVAVPLAQINANDVYPLIFGVLSILLGATAPTALTVTYATVSGTPIDTMTVNPALLVALSTITVPIQLIGPLSKSLYSGAGTDPLIQCNAATTAATLIAASSRAIFQLAVGVE